MNQFVQKFSCQHIVILSTMFFCQISVGVVWVGLLSTFMMVALNSRSAWSISALSLTLIFKLSLQVISHTLNKDVRSPRKVMWPDQGEESGGKGHPALLIDRHVHPETILLGKLQTESFKTLKINLIFCKPICLPVLPDQPFVRHLVGALFSKTKGRVDVLQDLQSLRVVNFPPDNNKKHGWDC